MKLIIGATYYEQLEEIELLLFSMYNQTSVDYELHILSNGDDSVYKIPEVYPHLMTDRVFLHCSEENTEFWGVYNRMLFTEVLKEKNAEDFVVTTSSEDYYVPTFVEEVLKHEDKDMVYWDFVTHAFKYSTNHAITVPLRSNIDWGCFAVRVSLMSFPQTHEEVQSYIADGLTVERLVGLNKVKDTIRIPKILFIKH